MSISRFYKVSIAAAEKDEDRILDCLQRFGRLHIIPRDGQKTATEEPGPALSGQDKQTREAILYLHQAPDPNRPLSRWPVHHRDKPMRQRVQELVTRVLNNRDQLREVNDTIDGLKERIRLLRPWGDFTLPPDTCVEHFRLWFYLLPVNKRSALDELTLPWQIAGRSMRHYYLILISPDEPDKNILPVEREHLGSRSLQTLEEALEMREAEREDLESERQRLSRFRSLLQQQLRAANDEAMRQYVKTQTEKQQTLMTLQGWLPAADTAALQALADEEGFAFVAQPPAPEDNPPTLLQPAKGFRPGAMLAGIYQLPGYRSWDPSVHLYLSFALFFAMILSDAGYSLILLALLFVFRKKLAANKNIRDLLFTLFSTATVWGVLAGGYLGFDINAIDQAPEILKQLNIIHLNHYNAMMTISVLVGISHIVIAQLSLLANRRHKTSEWFIRAGWLAVIAGGVCFWQSLAPVYWASLLIAGALAVVSGSTMAALQQAANAATLSGKLMSAAKGVLALTGASGLFGDILSYMRLFALGLASASLGPTFNSLAEQALNASPGIGVVFAALIFLLGHSVNLGLAIMSATVHGLRLNFIEFYNWGEPGEGYAYTPFCHQAYAPTERREQ
ncbi:MAG: hypothetical protein CMH98_05615 [Oceanospirillaceae bacterium]|nr:hypothetical protein [Oceanospirillaceae bacterium]